MAENPLNRKEMDELFDAISKGKKKESEISQDEIDFLLSGGTVGTKPDVPDEEKASAGNKSLASNDFSGRRIKIYDFKRQSAGTKAQWRETQALGEKVAQALAYDFSAKFGEGFSFKCISCDYLTNGEFLRSVPKPTFLYYEHLSGGDFIVEADPRLAHRLLKQSPDTKIEKSDLEALYSVFVWEIINALTKEIARKTDTEVKVLHSEPFFDPDTAPSAVEKGEGGVLLCFEANACGESAMVNIHICKNLFDSLKKAGFFSDPNKHFVPLKDTDRAQGEPNLFVEFNRAAYDSSVIKTGNSLIFPHLSGATMNIVHDGKIIAQGEAVVIDENFGVRVTEVLSAPKPVKTEGSIALTLGKTFAEESDIAELEEGKIVELDNISGMPSELAADGKCVAYGEIFVHDENIAAKITRVCGQTPSSSTENPFEFIRSKNPETVFAALDLLDAHTAAIILSAMPVQFFPSLYAQFDAAKKTELAALLLQGFTLSEKIVRAYAEYFAEKIRLQKIEEQERYGGTDFAVKINEVLQLKDWRVFIAATNDALPEKASEVKNRVVEFEDIIRMDDRSIQKLLREVDSQLLARSLKGADEAVQEKVWRNMSKRAAAMLKEDMEFMGPLREKDRDEAQTEILCKIKRLDQKGEIVIQRDDGDTLVD